VTAPKHTLAADELVRGALTAVIAPIESLDSQPGKPIVTRVKIQKERDMESARKALERVVTNAGDVDKIGPRTFEITWP
jgi:hypothetical protein